MWRVEIEVDGLLEALIQSNCLCDHIMTKCVDVAAFFGRDPRMAGRLSVVKFATNIVKVVLPTCRAVYDEINNMCSCEILIQTFPKLVEDRSVCSCLLIRWPEFEYYDRLEVWCEGDSNA
jgi:hypothetical protein